MPSLDGRVCLVTGASRGIGRGIALQLLTDGATCYITGRKKESLLLVKKEAEDRSGDGVCIPIECDHSKDDDVQKVFEQISQEQNGRLDLLVNNAYAAVNFIVENNEKYFWEQPTEAWDIINNVGLRNHYMCSIYASKLMVPRRKGLIINISSIGGIAYFQMPAYGVGKCGKDRMARDCAAELERFNVAFVSLWPGPVKTEAIQELTSKPGDKFNKNLMWMFEHGESTEFAGKAVSNLLADPNVIARTGRILLTTDLSDEFNFRDIDGSHPVSMRSFECMLGSSGHFWLSSWCPNWLRIPFWLLKALVPLGKPRLGKKALSSL